MVCTRVVGFPQSENWVGAREETRSRQLPLKEKKSVVEVVSRCGELETKTGGDETLAVTVCSEET
nr:hypothetical protein Iba_chr09fCG6260 [Ipomoea batatas]